MSSKTIEQERLARLESMISRHQEHFCETGRALKEIRDNRLYKLALFDTFEAYTRARWDISRAHAYRLIKYYDVLHNLSPIGEVLPTNESQVRHLARLRPFEQRRVWKDFLASGNELTAQNIKRFIIARDVKKPDPPDLSNRITKEYMAAVNAMLDQVRTARNDHWRKTSLQAALIWHRVIQENILSKRPAMDELNMDDRFYLLLHKKIMNKSGSAKRRTKKYYKDLYRKAGIIPAALLLAEKGVMEGRKCSGRHRSLDETVRMRFIDMVKASCDPLSREFIFITHKARTIKNYHYWLEQEFGRAISLQALRRCVRNENLKAYLQKPDSEEDAPVKHTFKPEPVFALIQINGCQLRYLRIRNETGKWQAPQVIETFDTGSRYMFDLDAYFEETSMNAVDLFTRFLTGTEFPLITICIRPDNAKGFLNLKRVINALNIAHSTPGGFYMESDFSRTYSPKDKAHLESSHRSLHNFEIRIIKAFEDRIVKTVPTTIFNQGKKETITVTLLDISLQDLKNSHLIEQYRNDHNRSKHYFSDNGRVDSWIPEQKMTQFLSEQHPGTLTFSLGQVQDYMKYGFKKIKATVSKKRTIRHANQDY